MCKSVKMISIVFVYGSYIKSLMGLSIEDICILSHCFLNSIILDAFSKIGHYLHNRINRSFEYELRTCRSRNFAINTYSQLY